MPFVIEMKTPYTELLEQENVWEDKLAKAHKKCESIRLKTKTLAAKQRQAIFDKNAEDILAYEKMVSKQTREEIKKLEGFSASQVRTIEKKKASSKKFVDELFDKLIKELLVS